jgi:4-amino-4-deoxy-L-arabinose transferase-like glycosyltransferase
MRRLLIALTLAGAALRFATLDLQSFWYDEAVTVGLVRHDLWGMLDRIPGSESTPPLYYLVAWLWTRVFGSGEVGIRSLSALLGTVAIPVFYLAARELTRSERVGVAVAALAAFNPLLVWYSQEARTYALLTVLGALSLYFFAQLLDDVRTRPLVWWTVSSGLALTAHYFAGFLVVPEAVWLVWRSPRRRDVVGAAAAVGAVGVALLPLAIHQQRLDLASFIRSTALPYRLLRSLKQFITGFEAPLEILMTIVGGAILGAGIAVALRRGGRGVNVAAGLAGLGVVIPGVLALLGLDYVDTRNVLIAWLPLFTVAAAGLVPSRTGQAGIAVLCVAGLVATIGVDVTPLWQRDDWRDMVKTLGPPRVTRAVVLTPAETGAAPFALYAPGARGLGKGVADIEEIALISKHGRQGNSTHPPPPPRPANPTIPGFTEVRRVYAENYTVIVFRRPKPLRTARLFLSVRRLLPKDRAAIFIQRPRRDGEAHAHLPPAG